MKNAAIVYWLLPARPERELLRKIIRILGKGLHAPNFEPHLTLFVIGKTGMSPHKVLQAAHCRAVRLRIRNTAFSRKFTKTLFVRFKTNPALRKLANNLGGAAKFSGKLAPDPHVSLLYKKIPARVQKELATTIKLPMQTVRFDSLAAVRLTLPVRTGADVEKWEIIAKKSLRR